jgi:hypothetical protein
MNTYFYEQLKGLRSGPGLASSIELTNILPPDDSKLLTVTRLWFTHCKRINCAADQAWLQASKVLEGYELVYKDQRINLV